MIKICAGTTSVSLPGRGSSLLAGAQSVAEQYPEYADQITAAAKTAFLQGDQYAYLAGVLAVIAGAALVFFLFPKQDDELKMLAAFHVADMEIQEGD